MKTMTGKTESRHSTLAEVLAMKREIRRQCMAWCIARDLATRRSVCAAAHAAGRFAMRAVGEDMDVRDRRGGIGGEVVQMSAPAAQSCMRRELRGAFAGSGGDARADWQKQDEPVVGYRAVVSVCDAAQPA